MRISRRSWRTETTTLPDTVRPTAPAYFLRVRQAVRSDDLPLKTTGYATFYTNTTTYDLSGAPPSWSLIPAVRHAMTLHPHSTWLFSLSPHALITNPSLSLHTHLLAPARLESLMRKDQPVVPPDSVIRTFAHLTADKIDLVLTQDAEALCAGSFVVRRGEWARFFLDSWFDPLYRSYNFQKAEGHALVCILRPGDPPHTFICWLSVRRSEGC